MIHMISTKEGLVQSLEHPIRLPIFEGPLDLLLFLIRKNEIDIHDIPIEAVARQYIEVLNEMEELQLEVAGEFFIMAATLMHIKSRLLLPKNEQPLEEESESDELDPRWELVHQVIEYKKFKEASEGLSVLMETAQNQLPRRFSILKEERIPRPLESSDRLEVWNVFNQILRRISDKITVGQIHDDKITVTDRMEFILAKLANQRNFYFTELLPGGAFSPALFVATFLAVLELARLRKLNIEQAEAFADLKCSAGEDKEIFRPGILQ